MTQLSNKNLLFFVQLTAQNLNLTPVNYKAESEFGQPMLFKSDLGLKMIEFIEAASYQLQQNVMDDISVYRVVQDYFDRFAETEEWMSKAENSFKRTNSFKAAL